MKAEFSKIHELARAVISSLGYDLLLIEDAYEQGRHIVRIYIENQAAEGSISIADCEKVSRNLSPLLDVEVDVPEKYSLEISSPGLNRPLVTAAHFKKYIGSIANIVLKEAIKGRRKLKGLIVEVNDIIDSSNQGIVVVELEGEQFPFEIENIKKAHLDYFATEALQKQKKD